MKLGNLRVTSRTWLLLAALLILLVVWGMFHAAIQRSWADRLLLRSDAVSQEFFADAAKRAPDPVQFLERCWATGKISHRQLVAAFLKDNSVAQPAWLKRAEPLILACTTDADASVRELGLAALEAEHSARLFDAARVQLDNLDPLVRLLGLDYIRKSDPKAAIPILIRALDDPDLRIVTAAEIGLMRFSGEDFGVRTHQAIPSQVDSTELDPHNLSTIRRGVEKRKQWWNNHQQEFGSTPVSPVIQNVINDQDRPPTPDFALKDLEGNSVRLSNFKGKVVLLNFWATWCTACLAEIPDLVALQKEMSARVVIIGVSLDGVPDEDGDTPGEPAGESSHKAIPSLNALRSKVERAVKARQINYRVLLDPRNVVGAQYNGGELPTTVIIDPEGRLRRRFVGERNLAVFRAMINEASKPRTSSSSQLSVRNN